jgi:hypothetical protein
MGLWALAKRWRPFFALALGFSGCRAQFCLHNDRADDALQLFDLGERDLAGIVGAVAGCKQ